MRTELSSKRTRGREAAQLLEDPVLKEAFEEIEKFYVSKWRNSVNDEKGWDVREESHQMLKAMDAFKNQLTSFLIDGKFAETNTNRRED